VDAEATMALFGTPVLLLAGVLLTISPRSRPLGIGPADRGRCRLAFGGVCVAVLADGT
jgi:hypothetical protein